MTAPFLESLDPELLEGAKSIVRRLDSAGHQAVFAGGMVRDLLLDRPVSDIDIATSALPEQIEALFDKTVLVGKQFGVVIVIVRGRPYEVATFRQEGAYSDGRRPDSVSFTNIEEDSRRRDFTVNALFLDPRSEEILDFVGGRADLEARLLRTVGDPRKRFAEDRLRLIRAVRIACDHDLQIDAETWEAVRAAAAEVRAVSWERIRDELLKILKGPDPDRGVGLLLDSGMLRTLLPEVADMEGVEQPPEFHPEGDVLTHTRLMLRIARPRRQDEFDTQVAPAQAPWDETLALAVLLHDVGKPPTFQVRERIRFDGHDELGARMSEEICARLRLPSDLTSEVVELVRDHLRFINVPQMREAKLKRFLRRENFHRHLELHRLDCLSSHRDLSTFFFCLEKLHELSLEQLRPQPLLNGHDLIALGLEPGPVFSEILGGLEDEQLEGRITTREEALQWVKGFLAD